MTQGWKLLNHIIFVRLTKIILSSPWTGMLGKIPDLIIREGVRMLSIFIQDKRNGAKCDLFYI